MRSFYNRLKDEGELHLPGVAETIEDGRASFLSEKRLDLLVLCGGTVGGVVSDEAIV